MFCTKCGAQIDDNALICPNCGEEVEKLEKKISETTQQNVYSNNYADSGSPYGSKLSSVITKKPINKKTLAIVIGAIVAVIALISIISISSSRVNAGKFINDEITFNGYNGYATINTSEIYDYTNLDIALGGTKYSDKYKDSLWGDLIDGGASLATNAYISIEVDKEDHLKNGDVVNATIEINYDGINKVLKTRKKLKGKKVYKEKYKVKGLEEPTLIDPFEVINSVSYDMTGNYNSTDILYNVEYNKNIGEFNVRYISNNSYSSNLLEILDSENERIGTISFSDDDSAYTSTKKISISTNLEEDDLQAYGIILSSTKKEYTPLTVSYLTKADKMSAKDFNALKKLATDEFAASYNGSKYKEAYFCCDNNPSYEVNSIYFIYSYKSSYNQKIEYGYAKINNLKINSNNEITNIDDAYIYENIYYDSIDAIKTRLNDSWDNVSKVSVKK